METNEDLKNEISKEVIENIAQIVRKKGKEQEDIDVMIDTLMLEREIINLRILLYKDIQRALERGVEYDEVANIIQDGKRSASNKDEIQYER